MRPKRAVRAMREVGSLGIRRGTAGYRPRTASMPRPLLAIDAPSLLYRAFFALPKSITDPDDRPVNALLGTANLILWAVEHHDPRAVVLCFGPDAASYRTELFPPYHADRPPMQIGRASCRERV